jgi:predicted lipoprotein
MTPRRRLSRGWPWLVLAGVFAVWRPWTVRPIAGPAPAAFDAKTFAADRWDRVLTEAKASAVSAMDGCGRPDAPAKAVFVRGQGVASRVDRSSRVGRLPVMLPGGRAVTLEVGPVIQGTTVRDALSFVHYSDFTNQLDYADAANALNDRVLALLDVVDLEAVAGRVVTFVGACSTSPARGGDAIEITPVLLSVGGRP